MLRKDPPPQCEHCQCNHFDQEMKDIFGRRDVVETLRFHPTLILIFLKQTEYYSIF